MSDTQGYKHIHYVKDVSIFAEVQKTYGCHGVYVHACHIHRGLLVKGKATPITSGKWEVIYISKLTKDAM